MSEIVELFANRQQSAVDICLHAILQTFFFLGACEAVVPRMLSLLGTCARGRQVVC